MRRRQFITLLGGAAAWPLAARAQQDRRVRWIGVLMIFPDTDKIGSGNATAFEEGLAALGWNVGRNIAIDYRWAVTDVEKGRSAVAQVLRLSPDLILANGGPALTAAQQATRTIPIVFTGVSEPVERGFYHKSGPPWRQYDRFRQYGINRRRKVGGTAQRNRAGSRPHNSRFRPGLIICKNIFDSAEMAGQKLSTQVSLVRPTFIICRNSRPH